MKRKGLLELVKFDVNPQQFESICSTGSKYVILAEKKQEILVLTIFDARNKIERKPCVVVFLKEDDYISLQLVDGEYKWRTGTLFNILDFGYYAYSIGAYQNETSMQCWLRTHEELIKKFTGEGERESAVQAINNLQNKILANRLEGKHKKITDKIDKQMEIVPELPEDFDRWIDNVPLGHSRYLVYKRNKHQIKGFCTHCKKDIILTYAKHNEKGKCPLCGTVATYKAQGNAKRIEDRAKFSIMQRVIDHGGEVRLLLRTFSASRDFSHEKINNPVTRITEKVRSFYKLDGSVEVYEYSLFKQRTVRWNNENFYFDDSKVILYSKNVKQVLDGTMWQYSAIDIMAERGKYFKLLGFLEHYPRNPKLEYVIKAGLYKLANDTITDYKYASDNKYPNYKAKSMKNFLGVGMELMPQLQRLDVNLDQFRLIQEAYTKEIRLTDEQVIWADKNLDFAPEILKVAKYTTIHKAIKYIEVFCTTDKNAYGDWVDYLRMCEQLKYDMKNTFVLFPKDLKKAHDEVTTLVEYKKNDKHNKAIKNMSKELENLYKFDDGNLGIFIPKSVKEILYESNALRHCVKSYIESVAIGKTIILFVRKMDDPDTPFYTLEVKKGIVTQCRGYKNANMTEEVEKFIGKFKKAKLLAKSKTISA